MTVEFLVHPILAIAGYVLLAPLAKAITPVYRGILAWPMGAAGWTFGAFWGLAAGSPWGGLAAFAAITAYAAARYRQTIIAETLFLLGVIVSIAALAGLSISISPAIVSYDSNVQLMLGQSLFALGLFPGLSATLGSWGVFLPAVHGSARLLDLGYFAAFHPLVVASTLGALLCAPFAERNRSNDGTKRTIIAAATGGLAFASSYFVVFQAGYVHNSMPSALFLLIGFHALWQAGRAGRSEWLWVALPAFLTFALSRTEAPVFATMAIALGIATASTLPPSRALWAFLLLFAGPVAAWYTYLGSVISPTNDIMTPARAFLQAGGVVAACVFLGFSRLKPISRLLDSAPVLLVLAAGAVAALTVVLQPDHSLVNLSTIVENLWQNGRWAALWRGLAVAAALAWLLPRFPGDRMFEAFIFAFFCAVLAMGALRVPYRLGWGDSANRMVTHVAPLILLYVTLKVGHSAATKSALASIGPFRQAAGMAAVIAVFATFGLALVAQENDGSLQPRAIQAEGFCPPDNHGEYDFAVALKQESGAGYAAACGTGPRQVVLDFGEPVAPGYVQWTYYDADQAFTNFGWEISSDGSAWHSLYDTTLPATADRMEMVDQLTRRLTLGGKEDFRYLRLQYRASLGQNRLLLRHLRISSQTEGGQP